MWKMLKRKKNNKPTVPDLMGVIGMKTGLLLGKMNLSVLFALGNRKTNNQGSAKNGFSHSVRGWFGLNYVDVSP